MRKGMILVVILVLVGVSLGVRAKAQPELDSELYIYNWSDYMDESLLEEYETQFGVKITYDTFASLEEMFAKIQAGAEYDVIFPSDFMIARMIELNLLQKYDKANVPNLSNVGGEYREVWFDPGAEYCVPYQSGSTGLAVSRKLDRIPDSWGALFDPEQAAYYAQNGGINILDDQREVIGAALKYLGYSLNETDPAHLEAARDLIIAAKGNFLYYNSSDYQDTLLIPGEVALSHSWDGSTVKAAIATKSEEFPLGEWIHIVPKEGATRFMEGMCIPATVNAKRKATAEHFINFMMIPEHAARNSNVTGYYSTNTPAFEFFLPELKELLPSVDVIETLEWMRPLPEESMRLWDQIWTEIRAAG